MDCYEINVVTQRWTRGGFAITATNKYYIETLREDNIAYIWRFISNNRLMAAKQKISFGTCFFLKKGTPYVTLYGDYKATPRDQFKAYCLKFEPKFELIQMAFTTARGREISVSIAYREGYY